MIKPRSLARAFAVKHIVARAKVSDWSTALMQAAANHWFASHSYILIPPSRVLERINQRAEELGVGVLCRGGTASCRIGAPRPNHSRLIRFLAFQ